MTELAWARAVHVASVVVWIGGVALITTILLPLLRRLEPAERLALFRAIQGRFIWQARIALLLVLLSGLYMLWRLDLWPHFADPAFWWLHAMVGLWAIFALLLFIGEPIFFRKRLDRRALEDPVTSFARLQAMHWLLLILALITIFGAVAGSAGLSLFP